MKPNKYAPKGYLKFIYADNTLQYVTREYPQDMLDLYETNIYGTLMSGQQFYEYVDDTSIINYDGTLADVFVNGYESNLGLHHKGLSQGEFPVDGPTWLDLCDEFNIEVNWCNK